MYEEFQRFKYLLLTMSCSVLAIFSTIILNNTFKENTIPLYIVNCMIVFLLYSLDTTKSLNFYIIMGLCGAMTENFIMYYSEHTWRYRHPDFMYIPFWLIPLWSVAGSGMYAIGDFMNNL